MLEKISLDFVVLFIIEQAVKTSLNRNDTFGKMLVEGLKGLESPIGVRLGLGLPANRGQIVKRLPTPQLADQAIIHRPPG